MPWTAADIPDQTDRVAIVTGANSGIGLMTARELARPAPRWCWPAATPARASAPPSRSAPTCPTRRLDVVALDLASLDSVRAFAAGYARDRPRPADQQRRRDGAAQAHHRRRLRAAVRHQPPRPLRAHRAAAGRCWRRPGARVVTVVEHRPQVRAHRLRRPAERALLPALAAPTASPSWPTCCSRCELDRRLRAAGSDGAQPRRPPRLRRHQPADRRDRRRASSASARRSSTGSMPRTPSTERCPPCTPPPPTSPADRSWGRTGFRRCADTRRWSSPPVRPAIPRPPNACGGSPRS